MGIESSLQCRGRSGQVNQVNQSQWTRVLEANLSEQIQCRGINCTAILRLKVIPDRIRGSEGHLYYRAGVQEPALRGIA